MTSYIAIISDTHDNLIRIDAMLEKIKSLKINTIIHCGDVTTLETLKHLSKNFPGDIFLSLGNVDEMHGLEKKYIDFKNVFVFEKFGELDIYNLKVAFTHFPKTARELSNENKYDFVFYGHTHEPWEEKILDKNNPPNSSGSMINPGTLAGMFNKSTFAVLNTKTKNIELIIL